MIAKLLLVLAYQNHVTCHIFWFHSCVFVCTVTQVTKVAHAYIYHNHVSCFLSDTVPGFHELLEVWAKQKQWKFFILVRNLVSVETPNWVLNVKAMNFNSFMYKLNKDRKTKPGKLRLCRKKWFRLGSQCACLMGYI